MGNTYLTYIDWAEGSPKLVGTDAQLCSAATGQMGGNLPFFAHRGTPRKVGIISAELEGMYAKIYLIKWQYFG